MEKLLNLVISGAVSGAIYSVMASGLVLTYQSSGIFNFAHGAIAFATAYLYFQLHTATADGGLGWPIVPAAIVAVLVFAPLLGLLLDRILLRRLADAPCTPASSAPSACSSCPALVLWLVETVGNSVLELGLPTNARVPAAGFGPVPVRSCGGHSVVSRSTRTSSPCSRRRRRRPALWAVLRAVGLGCAPASTGVTSPASGRERGEDVGGGVGAR